MSAVDDLPPPDPDVPCCSAAAIYGTCTCWRPVLVPDDTGSDLQAGPHPIRATMCGDCAYRPDSPERREAGGDPPVVNARTPFFCHDGFPRAVGYNHPDLPGVSIRADAFESLSGDYQPRMVNGRPYQADGAPGVLCAGWAAFTAARKRDPL